MTSCAPGLHRAGLGLITLALLLRVMVPAGFMPDRAGQGFAITICSGMGAMPGWVDRHGMVHKGAPTPAKPPEHPCAFAGFGATLALPDFAVAALPFVALAILSVPAGFTAGAIGRGLAAPPPPPTGPPVTR